MIRRGFWLVTGAALGVTGYRRASRLARTITGGRAVARGMQLRSAASFVRDVRDGMADYHDLHDGLRGRRLGDQRDRSHSGASQRGRLEP
jgi:hypothetical protein